MWGLGIQDFILTKGSRKSKYIFLRAVSLRSYPPPPSSLIAVGTFSTNLKEEKKNLNETAIKKITFFSASLIIPKQMNNLYFYI